MLSLFDITPFFWELARNIVSLDYNLFKKTDMYNTLHLCVIRNQGFTLDIDDITLIHNDVNALFHDTLSYLESKERGSERCRLLRVTIDKIQLTMNSMDDNDKVNDVSEMFNVLSI